METYCVKNTYWKIIVDNKRNGMKELKWKKLKGKSKRNDKENLKGDCEDGTSIKERSAYNYQHNFMRLG